VRLAASLIVRDEAARIQDCLASLTSLVDEIVVYDTGSLDDTVRLARTAGARVVTGEWREDFSWARNAALDLCRADWVLSVDADEVVSGDRAALQRALDRADAARADVFAVVLHQPAAEQIGGGFANRQRRLFRRVGARWAGRVHERVVYRVDSDPVVLAEAALRIVHRGYAEADAVRDKAHRNLVLGLAEVNELQQREDAEALARALFDVGRSLVGIGQGEQALVPFEDVRTLVAARSRLWCEATDFLARQLLVLNREREALELAEQLGAVVAHAEYAQWLAAQALVPLGEYAHAKERIDRVDRVVDPSGRTYAPERLREQQILIGELVRATGG